MAVLPLREMLKMRSLELKTLQIKDDLPLYVTLYSKAPWGVNENGDIKRYKLVTRHANCLHMHQFIT